MQRERGRVVTYTSPVNQGVITHIGSMGLWLEAQKRLAEGSIDHKAWITSNVSGTDPHLPTHSVASLTMGQFTQPVRGRAQEPFNATVSVLLSPRLRIDHVYLNGKETCRTDGNCGEVPRAIFDELIEMRRLYGFPKKAIVAIENNIPPEAGFSKSAAIAVAFTRAISKAAESEVDIPLYEARGLSVAVRRVSPSGAMGFVGPGVYMCAPTDGNVSNSYAVELGPAEHLSNLSLIIAMVSRDPDAMMTVRDLENPQAEPIRRSMSSRELHTRAVMSPIYKKRIKFGSKAAAKMIHAARDGDTGKILSITRADFESATAILASVGLEHLNDESKRVVDALDAFNDRMGGLVAVPCYGLGPNQHGLVITEHVGGVIDALKSTGVVFDVIVLKLGKGPEELDEKDALIDPSTLKLRRPS